MKVAPNVASLSAAGAEEILRPVRPSFILLTLFLALLANVVPATAAIGAFRPDFLALVLLYWCIQEPRYVGVGTAWIFGLIMDVADATPPTISAAACCAFRCGSRRSRSPRCWRCAQRWCC
jgi:rod shape-determining protein MreD